ncbi:hypothetical protein MLD52_22820, partial [Puniceicoccaceae bacterium K14]|nr:hypothetical protein [Puniceicoccaceae bacterium K14]
MKLPSISSSFTKSIVLGVLCTLSTSAFLNAQVTNPGYVDAPFGDLNLPLVEFSRVPRSSGGGQGWARINHLKPDGMGRLFVNDLRGYMYLVS